MGQRILIALDTHAWIWYATEDRRLSRRARNRIRSADALGVHPISCWEVAMLVDSGRLRFRQSVTEWVDAALERPRIEIVPFSPSAAIRAVGLGHDFPGDPADRFIVATALEAGAPVVTSDRRISDWGGIETIW